MKLHCKHKTKYLFVKESIEAAIASVADLQQTEFAAKPLNFEVFGVSKAKLSYE